MNHIVADELHVIKEYGDLSVLTAYNVLILSSQFLDRQS